MQTLCGAVACLGGLVRTARLYHAIKRSALATHEPGKWGMRTEIELYLQFTQSHMLARRWLIRGVACMFLGSDDV
jgi:hypothetical protein